MIRTAAVAYAVLLAMLSAGAPAALAHLPYAVESPVASSSAAETAPAAMSGMVVWESDAAGDWDIWCTNLWSGAVTIPAGSSDQRHPDLSYDRIVYEDNRSGDWDIYAYDLAQVYLTPSPPATAESPVATGAGDQLDPAVEGGWAVYEDLSRGNADIVACELASGETASHRLDGCCSGRPCHQRPPGRLLRQEEWELGHLLIRPRQQHPAAAHDEQGRANVAADPSRDRRLPGPPERELGYLLRPREGWPGAASDERGAQSDTAAVRHGSRDGHAAQRGVHR